MKKCLLSLCIFVSTLVYSQNSIKGNIVSALIGVPNFGAEWYMWDHITFQLDAAASFWTLKGIPYKITTVFPELRYYTKENGSGFYIGGHVGGAKFRMQKYNYWDTRFVQRGYALFFGATVGYQFCLNDRFNLELFLGGGNSLSFYKSYSIDTGEIVVGIDNYDKSGLWLPYRGGLMLVYKIKKRDKTKKLKP